MGRNRFRSCLLMFTYLIMPLTILFWLDSPFQGVNYFSPTKVVRYLMAMDKKILLQWPVSTSVQCEYCPNGTPTKRPVTGRPVTKCPVTKRPFTRRPVTKRPDYQTSSYRTSSYKTSTLVIITKHQVFFHFSNTDNYDRFSPIKKYNLYLTLTYLYLDLKRIINYNIHMKVKVANSLFKFL
jgi:hypothetical protein